MKMLTGCGGRFHMPAKCVRLWMAFRAELQEYTIRLTRRIFAKILGGLVLSAMHILHILHILHTLAAFWAVQVSGFGTRDSVPEIGTLGRSTLSVVLEGALIYSGLLFSILHPFVSNVRREVMFRKLDET